MADLGAAWRCASLSFFPFTGASGTSNLGHTTRYVIDSACKVLLLLFLRSCRAGKSPGPQRASGGGNQARGQITNETCLASGNFPKTTCCKRLYFQSMPHCNSDLKTTCAETQCGKL